MGGMLTDMDNIEQSSRAAAAKKRAQRHRADRWLLSLMLSGFDDPRFAKAARQTRRTEAFVLLGLGVLLLISALAHLQAVQTSTGASYDVQSFAIQANTVFSHQNVYIVTDRYPYPPVWIWIVAGLKWLALNTQLPFDEAVKIPSVLGDLGIIALLYSYVHQRLGARLFALVPAALYGLNPVAILISAGHGQFDALVLFFILLALVLRGPTGDRGSMAAGLALGVAISLKGYPVLVLPYLALSAPVGQRAKTTAAALAPLVVSASVYSMLFGFSQNMLTHILGYRSTADGGWALLIQTWTGVQTASLDLVANALRLLLVVFVFAVPFIMSRRQPATAVTLVFAAFQVTAFTLGVQYVIWLLPFLCLVWPLGAVLYTLPALVVPLGLYAPYFPGAVPTVPFWQVILTELAPARVWGAAGIIAVSTIIAIRCLARVARGKEFAVSWRPEKY
jgi:hypothetical protein